MRIVGSAAYQAGGELSDYEQQLRDEADAMDIPVEFVPFVRPETLVGIMRQSSVACLPSVWAEGFPLAALEAMATGLPVICSDSPGMLEACADAAIVAPMGEVEPLADAMVSLAEDDAAWRERSAAGWARAQGFSWERTMRAIVRLPASADPA
jgi:alpha-1,3-rhamnosyl/mannosyltransferase